MQRYFVDKNTINLNNMTATISGSDHHHIKNVMKMHLDEKVILCDGEGNEYLSHIINISNVTNLKIDEVKNNNNELPCYVSIAQGLVKKAKCDEVLRRLVELGASEYFNVSMDFSVVKAKSEYGDESSYLERRKTIVKEASEQSERGKLLNLLRTLSFSEFLKYSNSFDIKIACYEESGRDGDNSLKTIENNLINKKVLAIIGPEGGFSKKEVDLLKQEGFLFVGLGKRILRTETAPLYLMSILGYLVDRIN